MNTYIVYVACDKNIVSYLVNNFPDNLNKYRKIIVVDTRICDLDDFRYIISQTSNDILLYSFDEVLRDCQFDFDISLFQSMKLTLKFITPYFVFKKFNDAERIVFMDEDTICTDEMDLFINSTNNYCWSTSDRVVGLEKYNYINDSQYRINADAFLSAWDIDLDRYKTNFSYYCGGEYIFNKPNMEEMYSALKNVALSDYVNEKLKQRNHSFRYCFPDMWFWTAFCVKNNFIVNTEDVEVTYPNKAERIADRLEFSKLVLTERSHGHFTGKGTLKFYKYLVQEGVMKPPVQIQEKIVKTVLW